MLREWSGLTVQSLLNGMCFINLTSCTGSVVADGGGTGRGVARVGEGTFPSAGGMSLPPKETLVWVVIWFRISFERALVPRRSKCGEKKAVAGLAPTLVAPKRAVATVQKQLIVHKRGEVREPWNTPESISNINVIDSTL